jgi:hypothetical protein
MKIHVWLMMCGAVVMVAEVKLDGAGILSLSAGVSFTLHLFLGRVQLLLLCALLRPLTSPTSVICCADANRV